MTPRMVAAIADYQDTDMTLNQVCEKHNVTRRGMGMNITRLGINRYNWLRGYTIDHYGYAMTYAPDHPWPRKGKNGQIQEHIRLMELHLGRRILPNECVHHKDLHRLNNAFDNLQLMTRSQHSRLHRFWERRSRGNKNGQAA